MSTPANSHTGLLGVGQIAIRAKDLDRAVAFYRDLLGLPFLFRTPQLAFFACGATRLLLSAPEAPEFDHPGSVIYYTVAGLDEIDARLRAAGVDMIDAPHIVGSLEHADVWMSFFRDSEGNTAALMEERPR